MAIDVNNPYFRNEVLTAGPEKLRLLLLEGCLRFLKDGRAALDTKDFETVYTSFTQARAILVELITSMRQEVDPELCSRLTSLYGYIIRITLEGSFDKDTAKIDEAIELVGFEVETWSLLIEQVAKGTPADASAPAQHPGGAPQMPLSVEG